MSRFEWDNDDNKGTLENDDKHRKPLRNYTNQSNMSNRPRKILSWKRKKAAPRLDVHKMRWGKFDEKYHLEYRRAEGPWPCPTCSRASPGYQDQRMIPHTAASQRARPEMQIWIFLFKILRLNNDLERKFLTINFKSAHSIICLSHLGWK